MTGWPFFRGSPRSFPGLKILPLCGVFRKTDKLLTSALLKYYGVAKVFQKQPPSPCLLISRFNEVIWVQGLGWEGGCSFLSSTPLQKTAMSQAAWDQDWPFGAVCSSAHKQTKTAFGLASPGSLGSKITGTAGARPCLPRTLDLCPPSPIPQGFLCQNSGLCWDWGQEGDSSDFEQYHCVWPGSLLDLIRLQSLGRGPRQPSETVFHPDRQACHSCPCSGSFLVN